MTRTIILPLGIALALTACNQGPTVSLTNASPEEVAKAAAASGGGGMPLPGHWEGKLSLGGMEIPKGLPPAVEAQMKEKLGQPRPFNSCLTPEEASRPKGSFFGNGSSCTYEHFNMTGGTIDAVMTCPGGPQGEQRMAMKGTYSPDAYHLTMETSAGPAGKMTVSIDAKRTGDCTGTEKD